MEPPNLNTLLLSETLLGLSAMGRDLDHKDQSFVEACYDPNVMWVNEEIENIMENGENITPSIEEFMRNLEPQWKEP